MSGKVAAKPTYKLMGSRKNVKKSDSGIKRNIANIKHILADIDAYYDPSNNIRDLIMHNFCVRQYHILVAAKNACEWNG